MSADRLSELWDDEGCVWSLVFDAAMYGATEPGSWLLELEWTQEYGNVHQADWVTFVWQFYGDSPELCVAEAVRWCEGLLPFAPCRECDGEGHYGLDGEIPCEACDGTGLADRPEVVS